MASNAEEPKYICRDCHKAFTGGVWMPDDGSHRCVRCELRACRAERDALTAEVEKLRAKAARLEARIISRGNLSDDEHQALRRELGDASSEPYEATR